MNGVIRLSSQKIPFKAVPMTGNINSCCPIPDNPPGTANMIPSIDELKRRVEKASAKIAEITRTPKRMANWKKRQIKGGKANAGKEKSPEHREAMRQAALKRHERERANKAK